MAKSPIDRPTVDHLIQDLEDGVITPEDHAKLMDLMRQHASVRKCYLQHIEMVALLQESAESRAELGTIPISQDMVDTQRRKSAIVSFSLGIAALLILSLGFLVFQASQRLDRNGGRVVMERSEDASFALVNADGEPRRMENLQIGDKISLNNGLVRFQLPSGVEAIVEGPSQLKFTSESSVNMDGGMAWFRVPEAGHGFTVQTDRVNVVDLGTEFGVRFDGNDGFQVHVAKGKVRVEPLLKAMAKAELTKGQAMSYDVYGRGDTVEYKASLFRQKFSRRIPYLHWSFDQIVDGQLMATGTISGAEGYQAKIRHLNKEVTLRDTEKFETVGRFGNAFAMRGNGIFAETAFPGIGGNTPRTFAGWVRHHSPAQITRRQWGRNPYCVWGRHHGDRDFGHAWMIFTWNPEEPQLRTSSYGSWRCANLSHDDLAEWMHVASVYTGKSNDQGYPETLHYINGVLQESQADQYQDATTTVDTDISSEGAMPVRFGAALLKVSPPSTLDADLDEFYLFRGVLTAEQIKELMEDNRVDFASE